MGNQLTENKLQAIVQCKCPRCRSGKMFSHPVTDLKNFTNMNKSCEVCGLEFEIEPGFFWGAMYVSYAISVATAITSAVALYILLNDPDTWVYITTIVSIIVLLSPFSYRYSRVLMIYNFSPIRFDKSKANLAKK